MSTASGDDAGFMESYVVEDSLFGDPSWKRCLSAMWSLKVDVKFGNGMPLFLDDVLRPGTNAHYPDESWRL